MVLSLPWPLLEAPVCVHLAPVLVDVSNAVPIYLEVKVINPKMHLPSLAMLYAGHPVLTLCTVNVQADQFAEMAIINNGVRYHCTDEPNSTSTQL
jgi:hypothetical protein